MKRGELSNRSAPICAVDWRVLLERPTGPVGALFTRLLLEANFQSQVKKMLPIRDGAVRWIERTHEVRLLVFSIQAEALAPAIETVLSDHVAEFEHFEHPADFLMWVRANSQIVVAYTSDRNLVTLDGAVQRFSGWNQRVADGL